jgi:hypothetical protein
MSVWRQKAIECLPEERKDFEDPESSIYLVFSELLLADFWNFAKVKRN